MRRGADPPLNDATRRPPLPSFPRRRESERAIHRERDYAKTTPDRCAAAQTLPSMTPPDAPLPSFPRRRESERALHRERDYAKTTPDRCAAAQTLPSMTPPHADREIPAYAGMTGVRCGE